MKKLLPLSVAVYGSALLLTATLLYQLALLLGWVSPDLAWGGRMRDGSAFYGAVLLAIILNTGFLYVILMSAGRFKKTLSRKWRSLLLNAMGIYFLLNTLGNLLAEKQLETWLFTPATLLLACFCFRIAAHEKSCKDISILNTPE